MPSLSINSKDLDSLGINLKDLLRAIAQTKSSGDDVIKIKKRKKKVKRVKTKVNKSTGLSKVLSTNPFPPAQKISNFPQVSGGGGASFQPPPFQTRIEVKNEPSQKRDDSTKFQLEKFQNDMTNQIKNINDNQKTTGLYIMYNQYRDQWGNYNIPSGLSNLQPRSYMRGEPQQVDRTDRFGITTTNNFYDTAVRSEGIDITELPPEEVLQEDISTEQPTLTEPSTQGESEVVENETKMSATLPYDPSPTPIGFDMTGDNVFDIMKEEMKNVPTEKIKKRRGRPPKQPLTTENIEANMKTRSNTGFELVNPSNITPDKYAKEEMKKQEVISSFFTPRQIVSRKPIQVIPEDYFDMKNFEMEDAVPSETLIPTPPTNKISKVKSRLPIPSRYRSKSANSSTF